MIDTASLKRMHMEQTTLIINRVLPIFLLIGLGYWVRRSHFVAESTIDDLRKLVVNVALPASSRSCVSRCRWPMPPSS